MCEKLQNKLQHCLQRIFQKWGLLVGRKPWLIMPLSLLLVLLALGFLVQDPFDDVQISWAPSGSDAANDKSKIDSFGLEENQNASIIYRASNEQNLLTRDHVRRVLDFHTFLLNYDNVRLKNTDCSATSTGRCLYIAHIAQYFEDVNGVVSFPNYNSDADLLDKLNTGRSTELNSDIRVGEVYGGTTPGTLVFDSNSQRYNMQQATAIKMEYLIKGTATLSDYIYDAIDDFRAQSGNQDITIEPWTFTLFERTIDEGLVSDRVIINISIVLLITYSLFVLGTCHPVGCRATAAAIGVGSTLMAYAASFGLCSLMGLQISNMHPLLPFLLLGIGADDMYVIAAVVDQVNPRMSYKRIIAKALKFGGVSILITSFTDAVAFMLSGLSSLPALRSFAIFAGFGVLFDFIFEISFFASYLAIDLWRQEKMRKECCGLLFCKPKSWFFCCGKCTPQDECEEEVDQSKFREPGSIQIELKIREEGENGVPNAAKSRDSTAELKSKPVNGMYEFETNGTNGIREENGKKKSAGIDEELDDNNLYIRNSFMQNFLRKYFSHFVTNWKAQIFILLFFAGLTTFASWASTQVVTNFSVQYFVEDDQKLKAYYDDLNDNFSGSGFGGNFFIDSNANLLTQANQQKYLDVLNTLDGSVTCTFCDRNYVPPGSLSSWYNSFIIYVDAGGCNSVCTSSANCKNGNVVKETYIRQCLKVFFDDSAAGLGFIGPYVLVTTSGNEVTSIDVARSPFSIVKPNGSEDAVRIMDDLRRIASDYGPNSSFMYSQIFLTWEQYKSFDLELLISVASALAAIFVIVFIFSGNFCTSILVLCMMGLVDLNLVALIWYWGLELNFITMVNLILAIGLAVDYSAHIAHAYNFSNADPSCKTNRERRISKVRGAFTKIGTSVFHGAFSTFLAIVTISASSSYVFRAFFKQWFGIIMFGMLHAFFLLPVLLSLFGPLKSSDKQATKASEPQV